jgi:ComF family protein
MLKEFLSIFINIPCALCQRPASATICNYCQQQLKSCQLQQQKLGRGHLPVLAWGKYEGTLKRAIASMKYNHLPEIGCLLGQWLGESWLNAVTGVNKAQIIVVPIPLHPEKLQQRGFNQAEKIAAGFCQVTDYNLQPKLLKKVKNSQAMFNLNPNQRVANISNAFIIGKIPRSKMTSQSILLIDDIYTTGATVSEAAKVLQRQKIKVRGVAVVATPQKISGQSNI